MIRLADYVVDFLVKKRIDTVFLVSGGGIMYLTDAVGKNKHIHYYANHHEQASATCAESWARMKGKPGVCLVTTGPGSTNAITGVAGAWVDSIPMVVISGQVKQDIIANYSKTRQKGPQEINIIPMVKPITKYAVTVTNKDSIRYHLERAFYEATTGRPGPVWINIPLDIQGTMIDTSKLSHYHIFGNKLLDKKIQKNIMRVITMIKNAKRPILICGNGIRLSGAAGLLMKILKKIPIPTLVHLGGIDLISQEHPFHMGIFGPNGQRRANFALQNSDLVICIGASLNVASTGFDFKGFASKARKVLINIDSGAQYATNIICDVLIPIDAKFFLKELFAYHRDIHVSQEWQKACMYWKNKYPIIVPDYFREKKYVNSYVFMDVLSDILKKYDVLTTGIGMDVVAMYQAFKVKRGQRVYVNKNFGQMGWDLPAAIGACIANGKKQTICVTGDGSIQLNIQELQTMKYYQLPIKIFVFNNNGYSSIRATQNSLFNGFFVGADPSSGVDNPNFDKIAEAYEFHYDIIRNNSELNSKLGRILQAKGSWLCEVMISSKQEITPKARSFRRADGTLESRPLEDMYPYLPRQEIWDNMHMFD